MPQVTRHRKLYELLFAVVARLKLLLAIGGGCQWTSPFCVVPLLKSRRSSRLRGSTVGAVAVNLLANFRLAILAAGAKLLTARFLRLLEALWVSLTESLLQQFGLCGARHSADIDGLRNFHQRPVAHTQIDSGPQHSGKAEKKLVTPHILEALPAKFDQEPVVEAKRLCAPMRHHDMKARERARGLHDDPVSRLKHCFG